jgi:hypothetical protein
MSGNKSSLGKTSSSWVFVMKNSSVVVQRTPQKPYRLSPVHDRNRRGSGGLLSRLTVHASRWDGEDGRGSTVLRNEEVVDAVF